MPESPLVSIIMNCYNGEQYLREALDSVLSQTYQDWELIFWDNQSTDHSRDIFKSYKNDRFKYFYAPKHTLLYEARNYAIDKASGDFYAFLDVDDWWIPTKLEQQIPLFEDPDVGLVYGNYWTVDTMKGTQLIKYNKLLPIGKVQADLLKKYKVGMLTVIIRKSVFSPESNIFNSYYHIIGDFDMVIRLSGCKKLSAIQSPVAFFRWHQNNATKIQTKLFIKELKHWYSSIKNDKVINNNSLIHVYFLIYYLKLFLFLKYLKIR